MIAIITAMREELAPLLRVAKIDRVERGRFHVGTLNGTAVVMTAGGDGLARAEEAACELLQRFEATMLIGAGIAGGLDPTLRSGDAVIASEVVAPDGTVTECQPLPESGVPRVVVRSVEKIAAVKDAGAGVIDTESSGWAAAAAKFGLPFVAIRAVFDPAEETLPDFIGEHVDRFAVVRHALAHPGVIPSLLRLRKRVRVCAEALAEVVAGAVADPSTRLHELLVETSRTFALCIPLLPDAVRQQVTIAYLLFRIADTFEDASHWPVADRLTALEEFCTLLRNPDADEAHRLAAAWHAKGPSAHAGYVELIAEVPLVMRAFAALPEAAMAVIRDHVIRSSEGMAHFVAMTENGTLQLTDMEQLRAYCYAVAGIVGEMLTELFLLRAPQLRSTAAFLRARAATFGEGLQLVNILKDSLSDLSEGRTYIPPDADRADVMALARADLDAATEYTLALQSGGAPHGIVAFAALPVALAEATLDKLAVSKPGTKIGRAEVFRITRMVNQSVARGEPPLRRRSQSASGLARLRSIFSLR